MYWVKAKTQQTDSITGSSSSEKNKWETGTTYKGEWQNSQKHGYGVQTWPNGNKYEGEWANGLRHGHGAFWVKENKPVEEANKTRSSNSGSLSTVSTALKSTKSKSADVSALRKVYTGDWKNDLRDGLGVAYYADGSRYEGEWKEGKRQGRGTLFLANGDTYVGDWVDDQQNGFGTLTKQNQDVYEGEWVGGKREGQGLYYYRSKEKVYDGEWVADQPRCGVFIASADFFASDDNDLDADIELHAKPEDSRVQRQAMVEPTTNLYVPRPLQLASDAPAMSPAERRKQFQLRYRPVPQLGLDAADAVLAGEIARVREERQVVRALPYTDLEQVWGASALDGIRVVFARYDQTLKEKGASGDKAEAGREGYAHATDARAILAELGYTVNEHDVMSFVRDAGVQYGTSAKPGKLRFVDMVRVVHLCDALLSLRVRRAEAEAKEAEAQVAPSDLHLFSHH